MSMKLAKARESRVLGIASNGFPIYPIFGAEPGDDVDKDKGTDSGEKQDGGEGGEGTGGSGTETSTTPDLVTREEYEKVLRRMQAADEAKGKAEKRIRELDDAEKSELEKAQRDLNEAQRRAEAAEAAAHKALLSMEILKFPGFVWHDPEVVLALVDMDSIEVAEDGKVKGVKDALSKLAKEKPFLLKGKPEGSGSEDGKKTGGQQNGASGHNPQNTKPDDKNARRGELAKKYRL